MLKFLHCLICVFLSSIAVSFNAHSACHFEQVSITSIEGKGQWPWADGDETEEVDTVAYSGSLADIELNWELLGDMSSGMKIRQANSDLQCEGKEPGGFFSPKDVFLLRDQGLLAIEEYGGSSSKLQFYAIDSCQLLGVADVSTGRLIQPSEKAATSITDKGYCKCEDRRNACVGERSYCFSGRVYVLDDDCMPHESEEKTRAYNQATYGVDFHGWQRIDHAKTEDAVLLPPKK